MKQTKRDRNTTQTLALTALGMTFLATASSAQSLIATSGQILATNGGQAPGLPAGVLFGGTSTFDFACLDDAGNALFRARFQDTVGGNGVTALNDRAFFRGTTAANLALVLRSGDVAPGLSPLTLNTATGTGIGSSPRLGPDGQCFFGSALSGTGVTTANDSALFGGSTAAPVLIIREGDLLPGGAAMATGVNNLSTQPTAMNRNGQYLFQASTLTGGDVSGTTNNAAWITGTIGGTPGYAVRKGDVIGASSGGQAGGAVVSALGFISQLNNSGQLLTEVTLSTTLGTTPATAANDRALLVWTPGSGSTVVMREGDPAPGTTGATFNVSSNSWFVNCPPNTFAADGTGLVHADLLNGDVVVGTNDRGIYYVSPSAAPVLKLRRGDPAPGTDGFFDTWNFSNSAKGNAGRLVIGSSLVGGTSTTSNNSGIWSGIPGNLQMVVREGDILPGTVSTEMVGSIGGSDNSFGSRTIIMNQAGQVLFETDLINGDVVPGVNDLAWCVWDPSTGLHVLMRRGEQIQVLPGVYRTSSTMGTLQFSAGDSSPCGINGTGLVVEKLNFDDGTSCIVTVTIPSLPGNSFCHGDGTGNSCPCGNVGASGRGCANSIDANGARLTASGFASISGDTVVLSGSGMPSSSALYFQGTGQQNGGLGSPFGDGLRCAAGSVVRLGTKTNVSGQSVYPDVGDTHVALRGLVTTPGVRTYQIWYRNAAAFCTTATFNLSNGWQLTWSL